MRDSHEAVHLQLSVAVTQQLYPARLSNLVNPTRERKREREKERERERERGIFVPS